MQPSQHWSRRGADRVASGLRPVAAGVLVAVSLAWPAGCGTKSAGAGPATGTPGAGRSAAPRITSSPSARPQAQYQLPTWKQICAAARTTGITVKSTEKDSDYGYQKGCRIRTGGSTQIAAVTVRFESGDPGFVAADFKSSKNIDWNRGFAFSGPARDKGVVEQVGHAKLGRDYDDAYYAFFPDVRVAGSTSSETHVSILRGNALISFSVGGSEWHGPKPRSVTGLTPIGPGFGKKIIDQLADAMLALLKPQRDGG